MLKARMSLLTMSLLAITLAATIAHAARLDPSLETGAKEPNLNSGAVEKRIGGDFIPYLECIAKCDECTTCTKMLPMWRNFCVCVIYTDSKKPALQNSAVEEQVLKAKEKSEEHSGMIPYRECMETCDNCACTKMWPPESNKCFCLDASVPKKTAAVLVPQTPIAVVAESEIFPYAECPEKCKGVCACPLIWPPTYCVCVATNKPSTPTVGMLRRPVAEEAKESHKKMDMLAGPVEKGTGGGYFIPYPECIAKCDECPICTAIDPIERALCLCINHDDSAGTKKQALQNLGGDGKQVVLWTKAKMETMSYEECINTCELCACTLPWPPEFASCFCIKPKPQAAAGGEALPM